MNISYVKYYVNRINCRIIGNENGFHFFENNDKIGISIK